MTQATRIRWWICGLVSRIPVWILVPLNVCPYCLRHSITVARRGTRTAYTDPEANYETSCIDCFVEHDEIWSERWQEYYAGCL